MKKRIAISFWLISALLVLGQDGNQSQSIELPQFVITGKQLIDLPILKKAKADPIKLETDKFSFPSLSADKFTLMNVTKPVQNIPELFSDVRKYDSHLILGAGQYTLPTGSFYYSKPFTTGIFYADLHGINRRDYIDYADYNESSIKLGSQFFVNRSSEFLPGTIFGIDAKFNRKEYNFYSPFRTSPLTAPPVRELQNISGNLFFSSYLSPTVDYDISASLGYLDFKNENTTELDYNFNSKFEFDFGKIKLLVNGEFRGQKMDKITSTDDYNYYSAGGGIRFYLNPLSYLAGGVNYYSAEIRDYPTQSNPSIIESEDLIGPWAKFVMKFSPLMSFSAAYEQKAEFKTIGDHLKHNPYLVVQDYSNSVVSSFDNSFEIYNHLASVNFKFAYKKYYEINFGAKYFQADNYAYYNAGSNGTLSAMFKLGKIDDVTGYSVYANALYHLGPFGWFYGEAEYQQVDYDLNGSEGTIPYEPKIIVNASYGYKFDFGLAAEVGIKYFYDAYGDLANNFLLDDYINLHTEIKYGLTDNFDLTLQLNNLLNRDNYKWIGYLEPPFDFIAGIDFRF